MLKISKKKKIPKQPNFNKIPAKRILDSVEASTCTFGNQLCKKYIGIFIKNKKIKKKQKKLFNSIKLKILKLIKKIMNKKGKEQKII